MIMPPYLKSTDNLNGKQYVRNNLAKRLEEGDSVMHTLARAHENYRGFCERIVEAVKSPDPSSTEDGHFLEMRALAYKKGIDAAKSNEAAKERAKAEIQACQSALQSQLSLVESHRAAEIRGHLRSLSEEDRASILGEALESGDAQTIAAVTQAPAYLSGETAERGALWKSRYEEKHGGDLAARMADLEQALAINTAAGKDIIGFLEGLFPKNKYDEIQKRQAAARALRESLGNG